MKLTSGMHQWGWWPFIGPPMFCLRFFVGWRSYSGYRTPYPPHPIPTTPPPPNMISFNVQTLYLTRRSHWSTGHHDSDQLDPSWTASTAQAFHFLVDRNQDLYQTLSNFWCFNGISILNEMVIPWFHELVKVLQQTNNANTCILVNKPRMRKCLMRNQRESCTQLSFFNYVFGYNLKTCFPDKNESQISGTNGKKALAPKWAGISLKFPQILSWTYWGNSIFRDNLHSLLECMISCAWGQLSSHLVVRPLPSSADPVFIDSGSRTDLTTAKTTTH